MWRYLIFFYIGIILSVTVAEAQINAQQATTAQVVESFFGNSSGVDLISTTFSGNPAQLSLFTGGGPVLNMNSGFAITSGSFEYINQNHENVCTGGVNEIHTPNSVSLAPGYLNSTSAVNPAIFEFEFLSNGESVSFDFVCVSEEYPDFVGTSWKDEFGFFISGPGFNGPHPGNSENIALVPGTNLPITIDNVSASTNSQYFIDNTCETQPSLLPFPYQGLTVPITLQADVQCNEVYKITMVISNIGDDNRDCAVFFREGSFDAAIPISGNIEAGDMPVCEGQNVTLTMNGGANCTYEWSTGQTGVGLNSIQVIADPDNPTYSVDITCPGSNCMVPKSITLDVHQLANIKPYTDGINNSGDYVFHGQAGQPFCFNVQTEDTPNENVNILSYDGLPVGMTSTEDNLPQEGVEFCWTPTVDQFGVYTFEMEYADNNVCQIEENTDEITIKINCAYCDMEVEYNNRTPSNNPLPELTEAGLSITAGFNGHVAVGNAEVTFRAPRIDLGGENGNPGSFDSGPNFVAEVGEACLSGCDECCDDWNGFPYNEPPEATGISPDGDGIGDVWYLKDEAHPQCAFAATGFKLEIRDRWNELVYKLEDEPGYCCALRAPEYAGNGAYSSIYWPGIHNAANFGLNTYPNGCYVEDEVYYFKVMLQSPCTGQYTEEVAGVIHVFNSPGPGNCNPIYREAAPEVIEESAEETVEASADELVLSYNVNSSTATATVLGDNNMSIAYIELIGLDGRLVYTESGCNRICSIDLSLEPSGLYLFRAVKRDGGSAIIKLIKP